MDMVGSEGESPLCGTDFEILVVSCILFEVLVLKRCSTSVSDLMSSVQLCQLHSSFDKGTEKSSIYI